MKLTLGYSPCPNDTYIFGALALGLVEIPGIDLEIVLEDVETLNQLALRQTLDITKVSYGAFPKLTSTYHLLRSGGAVGYGCGPIIVSKKVISLHDLHLKKIVSPGKLTTAHLLLHLFNTKINNVEELPFDKIIPAITSGEFEAGVIIHEGRFTFQQYGLNLIVDLGQWWEDITQKPIPLGGILAKKSLGDTVIKNIENGIKKSLSYAKNHPLDIKPYINEHAQEMSDSVQEQHIALYVNKFSNDLGIDGMSAVEQLIIRSQSLQY